VLLLNAILTVRAGEPASHAKIGWEQFTDAVIKTISDKKEGIVFLLWGNFAKSKKLLIDTKKHFVLEASHPSPLGAHKGFFGCKHFSKTNDILKKLGKKEIEW
jgi:uracil-DNA glycosylase